MLNKSGLLEGKGHLWQDQMVHRKTPGEDPPQAGEALEQGVLHVVHCRDLLHRLAQLVRLPHEA